MGTYRTDYTGTAPCTDPPAGDYQDPATLRELAEDLERSAADDDDAGAWHWGRLLRQRADDLRERADSLEELRHD